MPDDEVFINEQTPDDVQVIVEVPVLVLQSVAEQGLSGPPGAQGPQGPVGLDAHYVHDQGAPAATWVINHQMNKRPSVTVVDSGGNTVSGHATYPDLNTLQIEFSAPFGGKAYLN